jgi:hypothetical protein
MKQILILPVLFLILNCTEKKNITNGKLNFELEKIVVINLDESDVTYFKVKVTNPNDQSMILVDNSLMEISKGLSKPIKSGFYLSNKSTDSIVPLGINNYYYQKIPFKSDGYFFISGNFIPKSASAKDSLLLKEYLTNCEIRYDGRNLDLDNLKKSPYVSQTVFDNFINDKKDCKALTGTISIQIPSEIEIKYLSKMPISKMEWDKL